MSTRLTPHFVLEEFDSRGTMPPEAWAYWVRRLCMDYLEPLRTVWGPVTIVSGFRAAGHNAQVGGAPASFHMHRADRRGAAADVVCAKGRPTDWHRTLDRLGVPGLGLYAGHVHADNRRDRARW